MTIQISSAAAELVPTRQYANVDIGPITIKKTIEDDANVKEEIVKIQTLCEEIVSEDRDSVHKLLRQSEGGRLTE
jgi:hypothetical protein